MISPSSFSGTVEASSSSAIGRGNRPRAVNPDTAHDTELVTRFNTGDDGAFAEIVGRYRGKMFAIALSLLRNRGDAEEIAQDTFIRAHRGLAKFRGDSSLACWLHRITVNLARNRYWYFFRRHRHDTRSLDCALNGESKSTFADLITSDAPHPAREAANAEFLAQVAVCMGKLNAHQCEILTMRTHGDHTYEEIAAILGLTLGTVKSRIGRARKNLHELLAQMYAGSESDTATDFPWFESTRPSGHLNCARG